MENMPEVYFLKIINLKLSCVSLIFLMRDMNILLKTQNLGCYKSSVFNTKDSLTFR